MKSTCFSEADAFTIIKPELIETFSNIYIRQSIQNQDYRILSQ